MGEELSLIINGNWYSESVLEKQDMGEHGKLEVAIPMERELSSSI